MRRTGWRSTAVVAARWSLPGAGTPAMLWGRTIDDPMQPVATTPWTARDQLPLTQPGYIRLLDSVEQAVARGTDDPTLSTLLARSGIRWVVVRNDLDTAASQATRLSDVHATLASSPGFHQRAAFRAAVRRLPVTAASSPTAALGADHPAVQIYGVDGYQGPVEVVPASDAVAATGSADSLPALVERGLGPHDPVLFGAAAARGVRDAPLVVGDGVRRREIVFGTPGYLAATMTARQPYSLPRAAARLPARRTPADSRRCATSASPDVTASSSGADVTAPINRSPANGPYAAVDGTSATSWLSAGFTGAVGQWLQVDLDSAHDPSGTTVAFTARPDGVPVPGPGDDRRRQRRHRRHARRFGRSRCSSRTGSPAPCGSPCWPWRRGAVAPRSASACCGIPGVDPARTLDVPVPRAPAALAFDVAPGHRDGCLSVGGAAACNRGSAAAGEEDEALDRSFVLPAAAHLPPERDGAAATVAGPRRAARRPLRRCGPRRRPARPRTRACARARPSTATRQPRGRPVSPTPPRR